MRLDRYIGQPAKFKVQRRQPDGSYKDVEPFDYFVLALKDVNTAPALHAYSNSANSNGDQELRLDVLRLMFESEGRKDRKIPD